MEMQEPQPASSSVDPASFFDRMTPDQAEYLIKRCRPRASASARKDRRDAALRELVAMLASRFPTRAAQIVAERLRVYQERRWLSEEHLTTLPPGAPREHVLLHAVLHWDRGRVLRSRQIVNVIYGRRSG